MPSSAGGAMLDVFYGWQSRDVWFLAEVGALVLVALALTLFGRVLLRFIEGPPLRDWRGRGGRRR